MSTRRVLHLNLLMETAKKKRSPLGKCAALGSVCRGANELQHIKPRQVNIPANVTSVQLIVGKIDCFLSFILKETIIDTFDYKKAMTKFDFRGTCVSNLKITLEKSLS